MIEKRSHSTTAVVWRIAATSILRDDVSRRTRRPCPTSRRLFRFRCDRRTRRWKISFDPVTGAAIAKSFSMRFKRTLHSVEVSNRRVRRSCDSREWIASRYAEISNEIRTRSVYAFSRNKTDSNLRIPVARWQPTLPRRVSANRVKQFAGKLRRTEQSGRDLYRPLYRELFKRLTL